ncbi:hypothetical protein GYMLUDRAFT_247807 [Collybiopsis luxurians FD-317 M1]|uniref:Uncharacterized protein n=1 Tax=Collybiopsis luxurians FD-317 M1 TaxID=944289 RepID=A0A0D0BNK8_9AGAR|nr:hypothetical protein GYMLUDRAFT_247807 [Collybiopsis luxurians FD-317 M1]
MAPSVWNLIVIGGPTRDGRGHAAGEPAPRRAHTKRLGCLELLLESGSGSLVTSLSSIAIQSMLATLAVFQQIAQWVDIDCDGIIVTCDDGLRDGIYHCAHQDLARTQSLYKFVSRIQRSRVYRRAAYVAGVTINAARTEVGVGGSERVPQDHINIRFGASTNSCLIQHPSLPASLSLSAYGTSLSLSSNTRMFGLQRLEDALPRSSVYSAAFACCTHLGPSSSNSNTPMSQPVSLICNLTLHYDSLLVLVNNASPGPVLLPPLTSVSLLPPPAIATGMSKRRAAHGLLTPRRHAGNKDGEDVGSTAAAGLVTPESVGLEISASSILMAPPFSSIVSGEDGEGLLLKKDMGAAAGVNANARTSEGEIPSILPLMMPLSHLRLRPLRSFQVEEDEQAVPVIDGLNRVSLYGRAGKVEAGETWALAGVRGGGEGGSGGGDDDGGG